MKKPISTLITLLLLLPILGLSQRTKPDKIKFGKIAPEDLAMTQYAPDTAAAAVVLADIGNVELETEMEVKGRILGQGGRSQTKQVYVTYKHRFKNWQRIKLLKKSAFDIYGKKNIFYYSPKVGRVMAEVSNIKALVIQPDGTEINIKSKDILEERTSDNYKKKTIVFPELKEGSIIEYSYEILRPNHYTLPTWYFQQNIPVRYSEYTVLTPTDMNYKFMPRNLSNLSQFKDNKSQMFLDRMTEMTEKTFIMDTLSAIKEEPFVNNIDDYTARLDVQMASYVTPSGDFRDVASSWEKIASKFYEYDDFGQLFENESNYKKLLAAAKPQIDSITTPEGKIKAIYDFVNQNVAWRKDDFNLFGYSDNLNDAFEAKIANSGELNLMIFALFRHYKIESDLVAISTRPHGRPYIELPSEKQFNHVLVRAKVNDKMYWLDAGDPFRPINTLRTVSLNGLGWVTRPLNPEWIEIIPQTSATTINSNYKIGTDGSLKGTLTNIYSTYAAADFRSGYQENKGEALRKEWTSLFPSVVVSDFKVDNLQENVAENVKVNYTVTLPNSDNAADAQVMYLPLPMPSPFRENPFKAEKRVNDITFSYPLKHQYIVNLELPEGYVVESLPKGAVATLGENGGKFQYLTTQNGNNIQIVVKIQLQQLVFSPQEYKNIQDFYRLVADKFQEQIVLKKK